MKIKVGSRGSKLALTQTNWVIDQLKEREPSNQFEVKIVKTKGDIILDKAISKIGDKGIFVKEIEEQLLNGHIDIAVHSMKDMPSLLPAGLKISHIPLREDPRDVLILNDKYHSIDELPQAAKIATGSIRRKLQLLEVRPDLDVVPIRGNVDTRIKKMRDQNLDGIILAAAGLNRLNIQNIQKHYFEINEMLPSPGQGALAIEIKSDNIRVHELLECIKDDISSLQVLAERSFQAGINGTCSQPIGSYCKVIDDELLLFGMYGNDDGTKIIKKQIKGPFNEAAKLGFMLAKMIKNEVVHEG